MFDRDFEAQAEAYVARAAESLKMQFGERPQPQQKFDTANGFFLAARRCSVHQDAGEGQTNSPTSPMICCLAFACELYIKSLLNMPLKGHNLVQLFSRLPSSDKTMVSSTYQNLTGRGHEKLLLDLGDFSNAFVEWRYIFEQGSSRLWVGRLWMLALSLYRHVRGRCPDWEVDEFTARELESPIPQQTAITVALGGGLMIQLRRP